MLTKKVPKSTEKFLCEKCNYLSSRESQYNRHCLTAKHQNLTNLTKSYETVPESSAPLTCKNCNKKYKSRMGLWQHSKKCCIENSPKTDDAENLDHPPVIDTGVVIELIKQNKELQNVIIQQSELINKLAEREPANTINTNCNNNTINNNQKFNLNFFLNETCKDAMSIQEFLENLVITFDDLLKIGNSGFVTGVSDILIKQLRDLDVSKRPIHCTDSKRETIYLKEQDVWNKDDKDKSRLKQVIEKLEYKNVAALRDWCNENPDARINNTPNNLLKDKIYYQTLQGDVKTRERIIKNISKEVVVEKE
jgi:protein-arginine kinase activator protein McsA